jgi:hypothetical protein
MCCGVIDRLFDDKRVAVFVLMCWLSIVLVVFKDIGLLDTKFMRLGPSEDTNFMGVQLNSWYRWGLVAGFTFVNTAVNDFMSDAISPWILNTITDHKTRYIPYPKWMCLLISQLWSVYCNIMSVFGIFLAMSQIDFVLIRMSADLVVNTYTNTKFMRDKEFSASKYYEVEMRPIPCPQPGDKAERACGSEKQAASGGGAFSIEGDDSDREGRGLLP